MFLGVFGCGHALCGVQFYCTECKTGVKWEEWGDHAERKHKGKYRKPSLLKCPCSSCCCLLMPPSSPAVNGRLVECADKHMRSTHRDKFITYDFWCKKCKTVVPRYFWEMHLVQTHRYIDKLYRTFCTVCGGERFLCKKSEPKQSNGLGQPRNYNDSSSIMYQSYTIESKDSDASENSNVTFSREDGDFEWVCSNGCKQFLEERFFCNECDPNERKSITRYCFIDHLFAKHNDKVKQYLPQYAFYCRECKKTYETASEWGRHVYSCSGRLAKEGEMKCFYCPLCKKYPETFYEDHIEKYHPNRCIYCSQTFDDECEREVHMEEVHKTFCPFCGENKIEVPLTVHIARDHEIWEGPCLWDRRREVYCTLCKDVIRYRSTNDYFTDKIMVGFCSDMSEKEIQETVFWHFVKKHNELKSQFSDYGKEIPETYKFIIQGEHAKMQRVKPCQWLDFPYSGFHVLLGHNCHKRGNIPSCRFCKSPVIPENNDTWHTRKGLTDAHWNLSHPDMDFCQLCEYVYQKGSRDEHLIREHGDRYWECPVCKEAVLKGDWHHGEEKHDGGIAFCIECNQIGTGSCPDCGEWVFERCEKCPQRIYGTCPQCEEAAFEICLDCCQYVTGKCDRCGKEVNGECLKCCEKVSGECPVCGERAAGWCSKCKQRVVGTCPVCGKSASGACSGCKQRVGVIQNIHKAFESHMKKKHKKTLRSDKQAAVFKADKTCLWCEACGVPVSNKDEAWIAHFRDRHESSRHGWCALCKWDFDGTRKDHLRQNHGNAVKHCKGCGYDVLPGLSKWHSMRHICYCIECEYCVPFEHMITKHGCTSACKPTVDYEKRVWVFDHDKNCNNRHWWKCDFEGCKDKGSGDDAFGKHIIKKHGCTEKCKYRRENFQFKVEHNGCNRDEKIQVNCPFNGCCFSGTRAQVLSHVYGLKHGCREGKCVYGNGRFEHDIVCNNRIWKCPFDKCSFSNTLQEIRNHMHESHKCIKDYCTFAGGVLNHCVICPNRVFACPVCKKLVTKQHLKDVHKCHDFCHDNGERGIDHHYECKNRDKF